MEDNIETDTTKANLANLAKIPVTEFEKHFHEWMERDDVARGLQAKLRCDLIKNFNKTNLGKQLMAHTMSSTGGSTYRLTLTPLVLALNTLVAEFLYAQNCHFTLSVFCTEVPFRNTLPDFEIMRNFRFNDREICEIWEAVTNTADSKRNLDPAILEDYETNPNNSLLLLFLKCLVNQKPLEMFRKSVEIQTEYNEAFQPKNQRSTSVQVSSQSPVKCQAKGPDNIKHINKYLLILSQKVNEMTREFELLVKQKNLPKSQRATGKTARSRELHTLNRSLERINENVKQLSKCKSKSKRLTNIVESMDSLTKQFAKCAENFGLVTRELCKKEEKLSTGRQAPLKEDFKAKEKEAEVTEKSYVDWINEMRTTSNGKKFLERVEKSLQKANNKYREQLEAETEIKMKHMKGLLKLHYKQKMVLRLSRQGSDEHTTETRKLNENTEMRLKQFEMKQLELVQQLRDSSFELQEAQNRLDKQIEQNEEVNPKDTSKSIATGKQSKEISSHPSKPKQTVKQLQEVTHKLITPGDRDIEKIINDAKLRLQQLETESGCLEQNFQTCLERRRQQHISQQESSHKLITQSQSETSAIFENLRRKTIFPDSPSNSSKGLQSQLCPINDDLDLEDEFVVLKDKLKETQLELETAGTACPLAPVELRNAILDAKNKFFEHENLIQTQKEQELLKYRVALEQQRTENYENEQFSLPSQKEHKDQEQINTISCELSSYSWSYAVPGTQTNLDRPFSIDNQQNDDLNLKLNGPKFSLKEKSIEKVPKTIVTSDQFNRYMSTDSPSDRKDLSKGAIRKEFFPKDIVSSDYQTRLETVRHHEQIPQNLKQALKDLKSYTENLEKKDNKVGETTNDLLKQSMAKMKQLFQDTEKPKIIKTIRFTKDCEDKNPEEYAQPTAQGECLDTSTTTTASTTSSSNTTTTATSMSSLAHVVDVNLKKQSNIWETFPIAENTLADGNTYARNHIEWGKSNFIPPTSSASFTTKDSESNKAGAFLINRITNPSIPPLLNVTTSDSEEESMKSRQYEHLSSGNGDGDDDCEDEDDDEDEDEHDGEDDDEDGDEEEHDKSPSKEKLEINIDVPELVLTPKQDSMEIGEVLSEPQYQFAPMPVISTSESSSRTDSEMDMTTGKGEKLNLGKTSDGSESDFWA